MEASPGRDALNAAQKLHLLTSCQYADKLLGEIEAILAASESKSPFPKYQPDVSPAQARMVRDSIARIRAQTLRVLNSQNVPPPEARLGSIHSIRVTLAFAGIAFDECSAKNMRGYGELPESLVPQINGLVDEMKGLINRLDSYLAQGLGQDLETRLAKLEREGGDLELVKSLERIIQAHGLVEFRPALANIVDRLELTRFEIAFFGRVSSGKSSLLNRILEQDVLPVGVTPVTAVTTRLMFGPAARAVACFADRGPENFELARLAEFATEQHNPANRKQVTRIVVELPGPRPQDGIVYVDTPGLGSLATAGAAETLAYLPHCDLGVVLVDAGSTLTAEDLSTIRALYDTGVPSLVVLSKSDLLAPADRERARQYAADHIAAELGVALPVQAVSAKLEHQELLDSWLREQILPLYGRHAELSRQSLARKVGALRGGVDAALRSKLERVQRREEEESHALETELRNLAGRFSEVRAAAFDLAEEIRTSADAALKHASAALVAAPELSPSAAIAGFAAGKARPIAVLLNELARDSAALLARVPSQLGFGDAPDANEFAGLLKEMPHLEIGVHLKVRPDSLQSRLGASWAARRVEKKMRTEIGDRVASAVAGYGKHLESWVRQTIAAMQNRFDSYADVYRAGLDRVAKNNNLTASEAEQIRRDLAEIGGA